MKNIIIQKIYLSTLTLILVLTYSSSVFASSINQANLINLTNHDRIINGLNSLEVSDELTQAATNKANDMLKNNYFDHYSPSGKTPWDFINDANYDYELAGENLAVDFKSAEGVNSAWMNSPTHKKNILKSNYQEIGIATVSGQFNNHETIMIVQMFGKKFPKTNKLMGFIRQVANWMLPSQF